MTRGAVFGREKMEDVVADYIVLMCGIRGLSPRSVYKTYLFGVAAWNDMFRKPCSIEFRKAIVSKEVKMIYKGFLDSYDKEHPRALRKKLPWGLDLVMKSIQMMSKRKLYGERGILATRLLRKRIVLCQIVGIMFMLRKSEHIESKVGSVRPLRRRDITFFDKEKAAIPYALVGHVKAQSVATNIDFSKADTSGWGRRNRHNRQEEYPEACPVCCLEDWIMDTRDNYGATELSGLYDVPGFEPLTAKELHKMMQWTIDDLGIPGPRKATTHSLRYGGATMMAAAGFPQYIICMYGGWSSKSRVLNTYICSSEETIELVSSHMVKMINKDTIAFLASEAIIINKSRE